MYMNIIEYTFDVMRKTKSYQICKYMKMILYMYMNLTYTVCI